MGVFLLVLYIHIYEKRLASQEGFCSME